MHRRDLVTGSVGLSTQGQIPPELGSLVDSMALVSVRKWPPYHVRPGGRSRPRRAVLRCRSLSSSDHRSAEHAAPKEASGTWAHRQSILTTPLNLLGRRSGRRGRAPQETRAHSRQLLAKVVWVCAGCSGWFISGDVPSRGWPRGEDPGLAGDRTPQLNQ